MPTDREPSSLEGASLLARGFWLAHLTMVLAVLASFALAYWQFGVWQSNRRAQEHSNAGLSPVALSAVITQGKPFPGNDIGRPITVEGTWIPAETFFVQGVRSPSGNKGYWAVTPVKIGANAIPVVRGWTATPSAPAVEAAHVSISGWLEPGDNSNPVQISPGVFGSLSLPALAQTLQDPLYSAYVAAGSATSGLDGLTPTGPTEISVTGADWGTGLRNFLYGTQWLLFAALAVYLWWRWCRDQRFPPTTEPVASDAS